MCVCVCVPGPYIQLVLAIQLILAIGCCEERVGGDYASRKVAVL